MAVGDSIIEHDQIDSILVGLSEKYNSFLMQIYENHEPFSLFDVEVLLYVKEVQLDKFRQELAVLNIYANITHTNSQTSGVHETFTGNHGRVHMSRVWGCGRGWSSSGTRP